MFWFHCGRCGSLFQAKSEDPANRMCPNCGCDPCPDLRSIAERPSKDARAQTTSRIRSSEGKGHSGKTKTRVYELERGRNRPLMWAMFILVAVLMGLVLYNLPSLLHEPPSEAPAAARSDSNAPIQTEEETALLNKAMPACSQSFSGYLAASLPESRAQFVLDPVSTAARMERFFSQNPVIDIDPQTLSLAGRSVIHLPGSNAIETQWQSQAGDEHYDAVFREDHGEWKLDWDHFVRFSDFPWPLFLAGAGPTEGEFRLLARERLAKERKDAETISIVLYAPRFGHPDELGLQSPEFLIARESRDGQLLDAAFQLARSGKRVFGSHLPDWNPDEMIRVRAKVRRVETEEGRKFEIIAITACHWVSVDDPGVELPAEN